MRSAANRWMKPQPSGRSAVRPQELEALWRRSGPPTAPSVMILTSDHAPGYRTEKVLGIVHGIITRSRDLVGIRAFILLTCMVYNLIAHATRSTMMKSVIKRGSMGVKAFVEKLAWFVRKGEVKVMMLLFTEENPVIKQYTMYAKGPTRWTT